MTPTPWRASPYGGGWRVIRTTDLGYATRVESVENDRVWPDYPTAHLTAAVANGTAIMESCPCKPSSSPSPATSPSASSSRP